MAMKMNELKFYYGNTNRVGVNYFDSEGIIKAGIDTTEKIISIFENAGFSTKEIHLAGGINELSHTGDMAYGAVYNDVKSFLDNAYSDYIANREKAKEESKGWLSSYNFEYFFVLFRKNQSDVRFFVRAGKDITIKYDECIEIATELNQIISDISQDVYHNNCLVEGAEKINEMIEESNIVNTLEKKQLFLISVEKDTIPLLVGGIVLLYTEKTKAELSANRYKQSYNNSKINASLIENKKSFFEKMIACGYNSFLLNGNGKTGKFSDCVDVKKIKMNSTARKANKNNIEYLQPTRPIVEPKGINGLIKAVKRLPKIHKTRLITAYILGFLGVAASVISLVIEDMSNVAMFVMASLWLSVFGLANMDKVSRKVKQKNPKASTAAKLFLILILIQVVIYIFKFINA